MVMIILIYLAMLPGVALMVWPLLAMAGQQAVAAGPILVALLGIISLIVPAIYLSVSWTFLLPLIIDRQMKFGPAMKASRRMVGKHWWQVFGLVVVCGLICSWVPVLRRGHLFNSAHLSGRDPVCV